MNTPQLDNKLPLPKKLGGCQSPECTKDHHAKGFCVGHYFRYLRGQDTNTPLSDKQVSIKRCTVSGCTRKVHARKLCQTHYKRQLKGSELMPIKEKKKEILHTGCKVLNCDRKHYARDRCHMHYQRLMIRRRVEQNQI